MSAFRVGHGYDVHKFGGESPLILGGVSIPNHIGLLAHSDGDVVLHALCDALLGSVGLGDIGHHFSDQDPKFKGIDSRELLRQVMSMVEKKGFNIGNLDLTIVAQTPKIAPHIESIKSVIKEDCGIELDAINVKATTTEGLGFVGKKEGIAVHAVVLVMQK